MMMSTAAGVARDAALSWEQRLFYETNGYLVFENFLEPDHLARLQEAFNRADARFQADLSLPGARDANQRQLVNIIGYDDLFLELLAHPRLVPVLRDLIGDDIAMIDNDGHVKPGNSVTHISWHYDVGMRGVYHPMSTMMIKVFYLLTDIDPEGGATAFMPGSHRYPMDFRFPETTEPEQMPGHVRMAHKAGTAYLFNGRVYHAALRNYTARDRKVLVYNYGHFWMKPWSGYEPAPELIAKANTPELRQLLHVGDAYGQALS